MENNIRLMQLVQNYPEKSNTTIGDYTRQHNDLWKLNYKHKLAHFCVNYDFWIWCTIIMPLIGYANWRALVYFNRDGPLFCGALTLLLMATLGFWTGIFCMWMRNEVLQLKLPL